MELMELYHGTDETAARCILAEGFLGSKLDEFTVGELSPGGIVFLTDDVDIARGYGNVVLAVTVETSEVREWMHPEEGVQFIVSVEAANDFGAKIYEE